MSETSDILDRLHAVIEGRKGADPETSHVARLLSKGPLKCAEKFGEEAVETVVAAAGQGRDEVITESADTLFHLMVLWASLDITPLDVYGELARREGVSGHKEKASRKEA